MKCPFCNREMEDRGFTGSSYTAFETVHLWACSCGAKIEVPVNPQKTLDEQHQPSEPT